ncbi:flagellar hook-length control protein FliK [Lentibacter algarum]|uniref:flagellar hook-length control protein FliK n=1 Tax=Lentibacter algarum TaxID=576131 RepID=UPI001C06DD3C|nr:flagellar hook-length control protein FliK [Lentibacter algarum]MBU2981214.1 flagellar hook-length control protein FliK [Lentibacter algarum]
MLSQLFTLQIAPPALPEGQKLSGASVIANASLASQEGSFETAFALTELTLPTGDKLKVRASAALEEQTAEAQTEADGAADEPAPESETPSLAQPEAQSREVTSHQSSTDARQQTNISKDPSPVSEPAAKSGETQGARRAEEVPLDTAAQQPKHAATTPHHIVSRPSEAAFSPPTQLGHAPVPAGQSMPPRNVPTSLSPIVAAPRAVSEHAAKLTTSEPQQQSADPTSGSPQTLPQYLSQGSTVAALHVEPLEPESSLQERGQFERAQNLPITASIAKGQISHAPLVTAARQALEAISHSTQNQIEIQLNPRELGKLKFAMVPADGQITVSVTAERPEVLDSLKRHIDLLSEELRAAGFGEASFEFSQQQSGSDSGGDAQNDSGFNSSANTAEAQTPAEAGHSDTHTKRWLLPDARLDIRL